MDTSVLENGIAIGSNYLFYCNIMGISPVYSFLYICSLLYFKTSVHIKLRVSIMYITGKPPDSGSCSNRFSGIVQLFLGQMRSDFGKILYMCKIFSSQVGKGPWELLQKLSQENI